MSTVLEPVPSVPKVPASAGPTADHGAVSIPVAAMTWDGFRAWAKSGAFPERGKVAYLGEEIFVDMSPERVNSHADLKGELYFALRQLVRGTDQGFVYPDGLLVSNEAAQVANEPDLVYVSRAAIAGGRARFVPSADGRDFGELIGAPDLVAEVVSPSSVGKDYRQLRDRYHAAGIPEYWLFDALGDEVVFQILRHAPAGYEPVVPRDGWLASAVLGREFRLDRRLDPVGLWQFTMHVRPTGAA